MTLPTFICVGAEKGGTTPLWRVIGQHRDVFVTPVKETHFFTRHYQRSGPVFYETYFFKSHAGEKAVGELTPDYMRFAEVPGRMKAMLAPGLKLIFCLRDPVKRAHSHYLQCVRILEENEPYPDAIALETERVAQDYYNGTRRAYLGGSLYAGQIRRFLEHFPRENMFFMILEEDFQKNRDATIGRLFDFLGVGRDPAVNLEVPSTSLGVPQIHFVGQNEAVQIKTERGPLRLPAGAIVFRTGNRGLDRAIFHPSRETADYFRKMADSLARPVAEDLEQRLYQQHFRADIDALEDLLGRDLGAWRR